VHGWLVPPGLRAVENGCTRPAAQVFCGHGRAALARWWLAV
jgi:hypothetical protein